MSTVLGPVSSRALGMTLPHEHCFVSQAGFAQTYPELRPMDYIVPEVIACLSELKRSGGGAIIDCTTFDLGRDVRTMAHVSRESGVHIIATTGSWITPPLAFNGLSADALAALYIREATLGIEGTGIKAGIIKCAHEAGSTWRRGRGFTELGRKICQAVARAQRATGLPITTHTQASEQVGLAQVKVFEEEGVDMNRVYIGHCNDSTDLDYLQAILRSGAWVGLDRTGPEEENVPHWEERTRTIKRLVDAGWGHRIMLSHDWMPFLGFLAPEDARARRQRNPDGYTFILRKVIPRLHELGVGAAQTDAILYDNPRRFLENAM